MDFFIDNINTVILVPFWVFLIILLGKYTAVIKSKRLIAGLTIASTLYGILFALFAYAKLRSNPAFTYENTFTFLRAGDFSMNIGVYIDGLSILLCTVVSVISLLVQVYSYGYMRHDKSFPRFFAYLNLFNFSMLGLVLSATLFQMYIFWELVGVSSYLLIGFWYKKRSASHAAKKAFIMNRIGDFGLMAGLIVLSYVMYTYTNNLSLVSIPFSEINDISAFLYSYTNDFVFIGSCVLLLLASFAKSAQFPLHTWLADAMEGPTPVSALIHSATMVAAGVYLVARLYPLYNMSPVVMKFIAIIGLITALIGAFCAITQKDLKRILAYSTNSQLGLMFLALGAGALSGGMFHLVSHAFFKAMLFLCAGVVIHSLSNQQDVRYMGGLRKAMPLCAGCFIVGAFAMSGIAFSGFYSKEMILGSLIENQHYIYAAMFLIISFMTAIYIFRAYFLVFEGKHRGHSEISTPSPILNIPIFVMALATVFLGASFAPVHNIVLAVTSVSIGLFGLGISWVLYNTKVSAPKIPLLYSLSYNKLFIDDFYNFLATRVYSACARACDLFDRYVVDGLVVLAALKVRAGSWIFSKMQTGNFQSYLAYTLMFLALIFAGLMSAYIVIIYLAEV